MKISEKTIENAIKIWNELEGDQEIGLTPEQKNQQTIDVYVRPLAKEIANEVKINFDFVEDIIEDIEDEVIITYEKFNFEIEKMNPEYLIAAKLLIEIMSDVDRWSRRQVNWKDAPKSIKQFI